MAAVTLPLIFESLVRCSYDSDSFEDQVVLTQHAESRERYACTLGYALLLCVVGTPQTFKQGGELVRFLTGGDN